MMMFALIAAITTPAVADHVVASGDTRRVERAVGTEKRPVRDHKGRIIRDPRGTVSVEQILAAK